MIWSIVGGSSAWSVRPYDSVGTGKLKKNNDCSVKKLQQGITGTYSAFSELLQNATLVIYFVIGMCSDQE